MEFYGLLGEKLGHSLSPIIHKKIFEKLNIEGAYKLFPIPKEEIYKVGESIKLLGIKGVNVTIPYKQEIATYTGNEENKFQIKFNNFQINFYKTLSKFEICDTIYSEQNIKIFSNFYLPISVVKITNKEQIKEEKNYSKEEAKNLGIEELSKKIENEIEDKNTILRKNS